MQMALQLTALVRSMEHGLLSLSDSFPLNHALLPSLREWATVPIQFLLAKSEFHLLMR